MVQHPFAAALILATLGFSCWRLVYLAFKSTNAIRWTFDLELASTALCSWILAALLYRLTLHPLANYPGPVIAACTDWYNVYWVATGNRHLEIDKQHKTWGTTIRYGPNRISFCSEGAHRDLGAVNANVLRSSVFSSFKKFFGVDSSATTLDPKEHAFRRRIDYQTLMPRILQAYESRVTPHIDFMTTHLAEDLPKASSEDQEGEWGPTQNMTSVLTYCIADIMADVVFSQPWNVQRDPRNRRPIEMLPKSTTGLLVVGHMQTVIRLGLHWVMFFPFIKDILQFLLLAKSFASRRASLSDHDLEGRRDIWSTLLVSKDAETGRTFTPEQLTSEAGMFVTAGTGTSILAVSSTLFYLLRYPHTLTRLAEDIRARFSVNRTSPNQNGSTPACPISWGSSELQNTPYLYACIYEAMRLSPGLPGFSPRVAGPGGVSLDGIWFPEGTELGIPFWSLNRDARYFPDPLTYNPDRWMPVTQGGQGLQPGSGPAAAFTPFGQGRFGCLGRHFAMQEVTLILSHLIWLFDIRQEPRKDYGGKNGNKPEGRGCDDEFQLHDRFTGDGDGPYVQFRHRSF
ncbi:cytochrome P450 [Coniella lustricola]|uniref:Cytochrome P450 n=1 Tax=Coniella lustricola TaxID=2025994 RepID=A0A2T2ZYK4_9PEZI|nr:cytochrome P450 [Coniella lustricola]